MLIPITICAIAGGSLSTLILWQHEWLIALLAAPLGGSVFAGLVALLVSFRQNQRADISATRPTP
jgi:hypothetical protein